uniref:Porphobilinogen deaminase, C-terminal domain n=1 Tax=Siphoviridae sp. ctrfD19 TaxID=2826478 RepID=A0A8S5M2F1_9CAUD|nr:MAG TPA: Porphobilinogen deaminase, C-terminal domain [Siphoviridae sp. ctrfD19]
MNGSCSLPIGEVFRGLAATKRPARVLTLFSNSVFHLNRHFLFHCGKQ